MFVRMSRTVAAGALAAGLFSAFVAPAAHASTHVMSPNTTVRRHVCAQDVYLRDQPAGVSIGLLNQGDTFDQEDLSPSGEWAYGMAYGNANKHGWVMESALC
jgi:hypothetical protein